ncbi:MAG: DUF4349 domain-containing protein, partial [Oscillospiraceae bacterium]|nr:DUF4349 domain-containing protein [Oscillospiraceae bacterium]
MKKIVSLLLSLLMLFTLCACGESAKGASTAPQAAPVPNGSYNSYAASDMAVSEEAYWDDTEVYGGFSGVETMTAEAPRESAKDGSAPAERPSKIIYSANVQVETTDFDGSLKTLEELIQTYDGWVESSSVNGNNYHDSSRGYVSRRSANYTLRFPSERFDELMGALSALGNIPFTHTYTENVTAQYYDVQARLNAYSAQEQRLLEMMDIAETVEDIIILEDRLTEVRYHIESLQSSLNNWDRMVSYSTVYLDVSEVQEYTPEPYVQPSFGQQLLAALKSGFKGAVSFFQGLTLFLAEALPTLIVLGALTVLIVVLCKKGSKKRKAKKA